MNKFNNLIDEDMVYNQEQFKGQILIEELGKDNKITESLN